MSFSESNTNPSAPAGRPTSTEPQFVKLQLPLVQPIVTYALLAAIIGIYVVQFVIDQTGDLNVDNPILVFGVLDYQRVVVYGEWYRLLTAMFLHLSPAHILFNAYALWRFGKSIEATFGHARFTLIYFLGGLSGALASLIIGRGASAGASGAIFAIFAAEMVFLYLHRELFGARAGAQLRELLILAGLNLGLGILSNVTPGAAGIDNWDHLGGFFGGLALAWLIGPRYVIEQVENGPRIVDRTPFSARWPLAVLSVVVLVAVGLAAAATLPKPLFP